MSSQPSASTQESDVIVFEPKKKKRKGDEPLPDSKAWYLPNEQLIAEGREHWKADCYNHHDVSVKRTTNNQGQPGRIDFVFTCKFETEKPHYHIRPREKTSHGT
ncbi:hypothetical protein BOTBODRAFT_170134 [Botryobasidium botryosum FD-172 SS1]|uniref:Uncharacterized protein n=1 Tax=Botryobasidium botryosum (strain FD-172 SS1) TaxID=930990 RepID=A0A067MWX0_BOTB1|nr:hypothetical protein BOTBODRAFT_170134 [Botryobasidium botryosum FD-172 SS1]